ncbi:MAG: hypothetical protein KDC73_10745 [Ignavibacteriae bacterium]|nr:hypothetical protein [Ignavibacteriota bacterium]MCB9242508.1 hypothetical protein [Ignavibacteriales bacterium]
MYNETNFISKELETLFEEVSRANTEIISETTKFLGNIGKIDFKQQDFSIIQQKLISDTIKSIVDLSVKNTTNLIKVFVTFSKNINEAIYTPNGKVNYNPNTSSADIPAFEVPTTAPAGGKTTISVLITNNEEKDIQCVIENSKFVNEVNKSSFNTKISFKPSSFIINRDNPKKIEAEISVPKNVLPGIYRSHVNIKGFEKTYFDIVLEVTPLEKSKTASKKSSTKAKSSSSKNNTSSKK